jgi:O-antigen/teichoic acid export membrane protein
VACGWRPGWPSRRCGVKSMLGFGGNLTAFNVVNYFSRNLDNVLVGWRWGAVQLGYYAKAYTLLLLPLGQINAPISAVALPALSRLQNDMDRFRAYYRKAIGLMVTFGMPLVVFSVIDTEKVISIVLGRQWGEAVPIYRFLGPAAFMGTFNVAAGWVYVSLGRTDRMLQWGVISSTAMVGGFFVGLPFGASGVAIAYSICNVALLYPAMWFCFRGTLMRQYDLWSALSVPAIASILAGIAAYPITRAAMPGPRLVALFIDLAAYVVLYAGLYLLLPEGRRRLRETIELSRAFRSRAPQPQQDQLGVEPGT